MISKNQSTIKLIGACFILFTFLLGSQAQQGPIIRNPVTTNQFMNQPADLMIPFWNAAAQKWSNAVNNAATATNAQPPSAVLTNLSITGAITNLNDNQFASEATIASIKDGALLTNILTYLRSQVFGDFQVASNSVFTNRVLVLGVQTNKNSMFIDTFGLSTGILQVKAADNETAGVDLITYGTDGAPDFYGEKWQGTRASPLAIITGDSIGSFNLYGAKSASSLATGFRITAGAINNWTLTDTRSLVGFHVGDNTGNLNGKPVMQFTAFNITNDANAYILSNLWVGGFETYIFGNVFTGGNFTNNGLSTLNGVVVQGSFNSQGALNSFAQDLTVNGPFIANESLRVPRGANPTTDDFGEIAADNDAWAASRGAVQFYDGTANTFLVGVLTSDAPANGQVPVWNTGGFITWEDQTGTGGGGGPGTLPMNANQFDTNNPVSIKSGALTTNLISRGITVPTVTADRAAGFNGNGDLTNSPAVTMAELEFLDGVTSGIQGQLNGKMNGQTNANQFGASTVLTIKDGPLLTNAYNIGVFHVTNPPGASAKLRIWQTNAISYTEFTVPDQWLPTNRFVFWQTNAAAGKVLKVNSVSISGGIATINLTNDFVAGTEVTFSDPNGDYVATDITAAIAELVTSNGSGPNASDGKVAWTQLVGVPAGFADGTDDGGGGASTNVVAIGIGTADITNAVKRWTVHLGDTTNVVLNWSVTNYYICSPSNTFTVSWINAPANGFRAQSMFLEIVNTNSTAGFFPTNGLNGTPITMLAAPSTNLFTFQFDGTNYWTESGQILTTGVNDTNVFNVNPVLHSPTNAGSTILLPTTGSIHVLKPAASSVAITNILGLIHKSSAGTIELDANASARFSITNRVTAATTLVFTNTSDGQDINVTILGEASGGSARTITLIPMLGHLVADLDTFGTALATTSSFTLTNGNAAEISWKVSRLNGTNVAAKVTRQFAF